MKNGAARPDMKCNLVNQHEGFGPDALFTVYLLFTTYIVVLCT